MTCNHETRPRGGTQRLGDKKWFLSLVPKYRKIMNDTRTDEELATYLEDVLRSLPEYCTCCPGPS